jgi:hypothetical protein
MKLVFKIVGFVSISVCIIAMACQKTETIPTVGRPAALTIFNGIPTTNYIIPVLCTSLPVPDYFFNAEQIDYGLFIEYSPPGGGDTIYVVHDNDTVNINPKSSTLMYSGIINLKSGSIYSLFLTGADTSSPDYLFTTDTLPFYGSTDSVLGIRFVNLSSGSNPISINLEGSPNGSEVASLNYKGITNFKQYANNSTTQDYLFVVRDAVSGDSLTQFDFSQSGGGNNGNGLTDPNNGNLLTFRNITIAVYGSENPLSSYTLTTWLIDDY